MAANLDKAESSLTVVSDIAYLRGIDSSGNSVRISKTDLASVLGVNNVYTFNLAPGSTSAQFSGIGVWSVSESARKGAAALFAISFDSGANGFYIINDDKSVFTDYIQINKTTQGYDFTITNKHATNTAGIVLRKIS